jgi:uncharacterized HAD superfamily protein
MQARRYTEGKLRYELIPHNFLKELAKVYTIGADKYTIKDNDGNITDDGADNWRKGLSWKQTLGAIYRHLEKFKQGEDFDNDYPKEYLDKYGPSYHLANAAWGIAALLEFYKIHPEFDDRLHVYKLNKRVGLDVDGVLADFNLAMDKLCGGAIGDPHDWNNPILGKKFAEVKEDPNFWLNLEPMVQPQDIPFEASCYITSRSIDTAITKQWLDKHGFADAPVYSIGSGESKVETAKKANIDYFIDDYSKNFIELNNAGICTFLMDRSYNQRINAGYKRIKDFNDFKQRFLC